MFILMQSKRVAFLFGILMAGAPMICLIQTEAATYLGLFLNIVPLRLFTLIYLNENALNGHKYR